MNDLIRVNYESERPTILGRELHEFLEVGTEFRHWFPRMCEYGFQDGADYTPVIFEHPQNNQPTKDYQLTIEMAKEIAMLQRNEKGKQARTYFIQLENQWNSPEAVFARALKMADRKINSLQTTVTTLETENKLLTKETLTWADRKVIEAIVKKVGGKIGYDVAWRDFKKELLYKNGICLNSRVEKRERDGLKKVRLMDTVRDDELNKCLSTATALARHYKVDISSIIGKFEKGA